MRTSCTRDTFLKKRETRTKPSLASRATHGIIFVAQRFVEGYVRERKRYLNRRVSAQREGHAGFKREEGTAGGGGGGRSKKAVTDAEKAEFVVSETDGWAIPSMYVG